MNWSKLREYTLQSLYFLHINLILKIVNVIWMKLKNIMVSDRSLTQKSHVLYDYIYVKYPEQVNPETKSRLAGTSTSGEWGGSNY